MDHLFRDVAQNNIARYLKRFNEHQHSIKTLGWGSVEQQEYRFAQASNFDLESKKILDIGCGFGDLYHFFKRNNVNFDEYIGLEITKELIEKIQSENLPNARFLNEDISEGNLTEPIADIGIMLGLLNWNLQDKARNLAFSKLMISNAFKLVNEALVVDFLSTNLTDSYPKEDAVFYHNPIEMFEFALTLSPNVKLVHNYEPIPQKEFMLYIYK